MISIRTLIHRLQKLGTDHGDGTPVAVDEMEWVSGIVRVETPELAELREALKDSNAVHVAMLRGEIAKPSVEQIIHVYRPEALLEALGAPDMAELRAALDNLERENRRLREQLAGT